MSVDGVFGVGSAPFGRPGAGIRTEMDLLSSFGFKIGTAEECEAAAEGGTLGAAFTGEDAMLWTSGIEDVNDTGNFPPVLDSSI